MECVKCRAINRQIEMISDSTPLVREKCDACKKQGSRIHVVDVEKVAIEIVNVLSRHGVITDHVNLVLERAKGIIGAQKVMSIPEKAD